MNEKLIIMDYSVGEVHIYDVLPDTNIDEDFIRDLGFNINTCSWMFSNTIEIVYHKEAI